MAGLISKSSLKEKEKILILKVRVLDEFKAFTKDY